ncbi:MAG: hypothetical protein CVV27_04590 [Candidatus Melainabacteria bacterium HGW-Melainabacteria-1]|nr:MAG: hypothetical protein CVV27_04590 [Candidatus Melainabacteria bacterium HGW-Melainabacteria-1]
MKTRSMGKLTVLLTASLLTGCQLSPLTQAAAVGALSFRLQTPTQQNGFRLQEIPPGTNRFEIELRGTGLPEPLKQTVNTQGGSTQTLMIQDIPIGPKQVWVKALQDQNILAEGLTEVRITPGVTSELTLVLQANRDVKIETQSAFLLDLELQTSISGEGLVDPRQSKVLIPVGSDSGDLTKLPLGDKLAEIVYVAKVKEESIASRPQKVAFKVDATGGTIAADDPWTVFSNEQFQQIVAQFSIQELEALLGRLDENQILAFLSKFTREQVADFFWRLPALTRERLRQNPRAVPFLPPESERPASAPSPVPSANITEADLKTNVRLALSQPLRPGQLLISPARDIPGEVRVLNLTGTLVPEQNVWGLVVRTISGDTGEVGYAYELRRADGGVVASGSGTLRQRVTFEGRNFSGDVISFNSGQLVSLQSGPHVLQLRLTPADGSQEQIDYNINVVS